jgi:hypothetical protein
LGNSIVQILVDIRCGDRVDGGRGHFPPCGRERLIDDDVDVIKPSKFCNVLMAQRRIHIEHRGRQQPNECVFPNGDHEAALRAAREQILPCGRTARQFTFLPKGSSFVSLARFWGGGRRQSVAGTKKA